MHVTKKRILEDLVKHYSICGFVVGWPLLGSGDGRLGASCGKVLHTLESLLIQDTLSYEVVSSSSEEYVAKKTRPKKRFNSIISINRPFTLLDTRIARNTNNCDDHSSEPDEWGRSVTFSRVPPASTNVDHYHVFQHCRSSIKSNELNDGENSISASLLLKQFIKEHWQISVSNSTPDNNIRMRPNLITAPRRDYKLSNKKNTQNRDSILLREQQSYSISTAQQIDDVGCNMIFSHSLL